MRRLEMHWRRDTSNERLLPAIDTQAPAIAGLEPREPALRHRGHEVVAARYRESEKRFGHLGAHDVQAGIARSRAAAAVAVETGQGIERAWVERPTEYVARSHTYRVG